MVSGQINTRYITLCTVLHIFTVFYITGTETAGDEALTNDKVDAEEPVEELCDPVASDGAQLTQPNAGQQEQEAGVAN